MEQVQDPPSDASSVRRQLEASGADKRRGAYETARGTADPQHWRGEFPGILPGLSRCDPKGSNRFTVRFQIHVCFSICFGQEEKASDAVPPGKGVKAPQGGPGARREDLPLHDPLGGPAP